MATGVAVAQPKKDDKKAPAPAATPAGAPAPTPAAADGAAAPAEEAPPSDMEGRDENPDAPRGTEPAGTVTAPGPAPVKKTGYPIELAARPITLPENMAEVALDPHARVANSFSATTTLRARYGITRQVQIGLSYVIGGDYDDPANGTKTANKFHPGKAGGVDVAYLVTNWMAVQVGLPMYLDPFAMSLSLGAPIKFNFGDKWAIGGLDNLLNIALPTGAKFAPSLYQEEINAKAAYADTMTGTQSHGQLRFSGFGIYQQAPNLAIIGRGAIELENFEANRGNSGYGGTTTSLHGGVLYTAKPFFDVGATLGWDDLATVSSFTVSGYLAARI